MYLDINRASIAILASFDCMHGIVDIGRKPLPFVEAGYIQHFLAAPDITAGILNHSCQLIRCKEFIPVMRSCHVGPKLPKNSAIRILC